VSQVLTNLEIASFVGAAVFKKEEGDIVVHALSESLAQLNGFTPDRIRASIYVITDEEMTEVRVGFTGHQGFSFEFKIFSDEATEKRIQRYMTHFMNKHNAHLNMKR
jgi:hypothetical protein